MHKIKEIKGDMMPFAASVLFTPSLDSVFY